MLSKKATGFSFAVLLLFTSAWVANAQDVQTRPATPQATPKKLDTKKDQIAPCATQLSHCRSILKTRDEKIQALEQTIVRLLQEAAFPCGSLPPPGR